jgi:type IV pilus assembly protein PilE
VKPLHLTFRNGFSLIELMVVVTIVAILMGVMLPSYRAYVIKAKRSVARAELLTALARQEQFFILNKQYAFTLDQLGYSSNPYAINANGEPVALTALDRSYIIILLDMAPASSPQAFSLRATPQLGQAHDAQCGFLQLTSLGVKSAEGGSIAYCW